MTSYTEVVGAPEITITLTFTATMIVTSDTAITVAADRSPDLSHSIWTPIAVGPAVQLVFEPPLKFLDSPNLLTL